MHLERHESDDEHGYDYGQEKYRLTDDIRELYRALIPKKDTSRSSESWAGDAASSSMQQQQQQQQQQQLGYRTVSEN